MRSRIEIETDAALRIAQAMGESIEGLERFWPTSNRGSNAQRFLDEIKEKRAAIEQCLLDASK